jgi:hypothetical protein
MRAVNCHCMSHAQCCHVPVSLSAGSFLLDPCSLLDGILTTKILQNQFSNIIPQVTPSDTALCYSPCLATFLNILSLIQITHCCPLPNYSLSMCYLVGSSSVLCWCITPTMFTSIPSTSIRISS